MRGFHETLNELRPTAVYASAFPYWHMHQLAAWGERRRRARRAARRHSSRGQLGVRSFEHPEIVRAGGRLRRQHRVRGPLRGRARRAARPDHRGRSRRRSRRAHSRPTPSSQKRRRQPPPPRPLPRAPDCPARASTPSSRRCPRSGRGIRRSRSWSPARRPTTPTSCDEPRSRSRRATTCVGCPTSPRARRRRCWRRRPSCSIRHAPSPSGSSSSRRGRSAYRSSDVGPALSPTSSKTASPGS